MIDILMATYNGGSFLREQLDSIINQTYSNWRLLIRDDGSSDGTVELVKTYAYKDKRIHLVEDTVICGSPESNFMRLLLFSSSEYVCFCDQDDIWLKDKLVLMLECIKRRDNSRPQLLFSDGFLYYGEQRNDLPRLLKARPRQLHEALFCNGGIHGSLSMFNAAMRTEMLRKYNHIAMHDHLLTLIGCANHAVTYLEIPTFYYRQHLNNVTPHMASRLFRRILNAFTVNKKRCVVDKDYYLGVKAFYDEYINELSPKDRKVVEIYLDLPNRSPLVRFMSIVKNGFSLNNSRMNLLLKVLLKKYISFL
jgi:glycosyltransferase involved in cell wall biosynthesis